MGELKEQEQRFTEILGADDLTVTLKSVTLYRDYLRKHLDTPCVMTGIEDFPWEEYAPGLTEGPEGEAVKEEQPLRTDTYELKRFEDPMDEVTGILVKVKRVSDNHRFILKLASLRAVDRESKNFTLLDDYSTWFVTH